MWLPLSSRRCGGDGCRSTVSATRFDPGARRVDQHPRRHHVALAARIEDEPPDVAALGAHAAGSRADHRAAFGGVHRIEHDEARVVGEAVGIFEGMMEDVAQRLAGRVDQQIELARAGENFAPADPVIKEQAEPQQQGRAPRRIDRQHEAQRPNKVRRRPQQHFALGERCAHQAKFAVFQIAQAAVDQLRGRRRGGGRQVVLLQEHDPQTASGRIARDAGPIDAAADDRQVEISH